MDDPVSFVIYCVGLLLCISGGVATAMFCVFLTAESVSKWLGRAYAVSRNTHAFLVFRRIQRRVKKLEQSK